MKALLGLFYQYFPRDQRPTDRPTADPPRPQEKERRAVAYIAEVGGREGGKEGGKGTVGERGGRRQHTHTRMELEEKKERKKKAMEE